MRKSRLFALVLVALFAALPAFAQEEAVAASAPGAPPAAPAAEEAADGQIQYKSLAPNVIYNTGGEDMFVPAGHEVNLPGEFTAKTDAAGKALIVFGDAAKILLKPNTEAKVGPGTLAIRQGDTWMRFTKRGSEFKIKTPSAVLGIRGTSFKVRVEEGGLTEVSLIEGEVAIATDQAETLLTPGHVAKIDGATQAIAIDKIDPAVAEEYKAETPSLELNLREGGEAPSLLDEKLRKESGTKIDVQKVNELDAVTNELQKE